MNVKKLALLCSAVAILIATAAGALLLKESGSSADDQVVPAYTRPATAAEEAMLRRAEERLISRCMAEHDFEYRERPEPPARTAAEREFPYVVDDVAWARKYGYGLSLGQNQPGEADPSVAKLSTADQRSYQDKLLGTGRQITVDLPAGGRLSISDKGCVSTARKSLYGDLRGWFTAAKTVDSMERAARREVRADPRYQAAVKDWATCVRRTVPGVADPGELREELDRRIDKAPGAERKLAVLEATCANSSSLARTIRAIEPVHRAALAAKYTDDQRRLYAYEVAALPRARAALG